MVIYTEINSNGWFSKLPLILQCKAKPINQFIIHAEEKIPSYKNRFDETKCAFGVFKARLKENNGWLVGERLNNADISAFPRVRKVYRINIDFDEFLALKACIEKIEGIQEGLDK